MDEVKKTAFNIIGDDEAENLVKKATDSSTDITTIKDFRNVFADNTAKIVYLVSKHAYRRGREVTGSDVGAAADQLRTPARPLKGSSGNSGPPEVGIPEPPIGGPRRPFPPKGDENLQNLAQNAITESEVEELLSKALGGSPADQAVQALRHVLIEEAVNLASIIGDRAYRRGPISPPPPPDNTEATIQSVMRPGSGGGTGGGGTGGGGTGGGGPGGIPDPGDIPTGGGNTTRQDNIAQRLQQNLSDLEWTIQNSINSTPGDERGERVEIKKGESKTVEIANWTRGDRGLGKLAIPVANSGAWQKTKREQGNNRAFAGAHAIAGGTGDPWAWAEIGVKFMPNDSGRLRLEIAGSYTGFVEYIGIPKLFGGAAAQLDLRLQVTNRSVKDTGGPGGLNHPQPKDQPIWTPSTGPVADWTQRKNESYNRTVELDVNAGNIYTITLRAKAKISLIGAGTAVAHCYDDGDQFKIKEFDWEADATEDGYLEWSYIEMNLD